jgi:hypothetical protein
MLGMSVSDLGCVKTQERSIAMEELIRPRSFQDVEISKRLRSVSMSEGTDTCIGRAVWMGLLQRQVDHVSMTYPAFGNNVVGNALHIGATSLKYCNFHATLLIEMHVQRRLCEVVVLVEIACEALRQFALSVVVNIDQSRHTKLASTDLHGCLLEASAGEVADRL